MRTFCKSRRCITKDVNDEIQARFYYSLFTDRFVSCHYMGVIRLEGYHCVSYNLLYQCRYFWPAFTYEKNMNLSEMNAIQFLLIFGQIFLLFWLDPLRRDAVECMSVEVSIPLLEW